MFRSCSRCGTIHPYSTKCSKGKVYRGGQERELRTSHAWRIKAKQIKANAHYLCEVCKDSGVYSYDRLEVHHIYKVKDDPTKLLDNYNLITLCVEHHKSSDKGKICKEYLLSLAKAREDPP